MRADEPLIAEQQILLQVHALERGMELTDAVADISEGERLCEPVGPAPARGIEVPEIAVDVAARLRTS
jgi:hypothetical protein